jgi:cell division protein FtsN
MANSERGGAYQPRSDDVRVFDGSEDEDDAEGSRLPLLIVLALFVLAAFAGVVYLAYTQGVQKGHLDAPRVIAAQSGPAKVAPTGSSDSAPSMKGLKIYQQPAPSDEEADDVPQTVTAAAPPGTSLAPADASPRTAEAIAKPVVTPPKPAATPAKSAAIVPPPAAVTTSPLAPVAKVHAAPASTVASGPPASLAPAAKTAPASSGGAFALQIGAYKSEADADTAWHVYQSKHAALLSGYSSDVRKVDLGEKGTWYRLRVGSFADKDVAKALCDRLTADGGNCFPAK